MRSPSPSTRANSVDGRLSSAPCRDLDLLAEPNPAVACEMNRERRGRYAGSSTTPAPGANIRVFQRGPSTCAKQLTPSLVARSSAITSGRSDGDLAGRARQYATEPGSPGEVASLRPDVIALERATSDGVNCFAHVDGPRWKTRMFAPGAGVVEDPATGSAAGPLAIHLARHGRIRFGEQIEISQGAELNRPSTLFARVEGEGDRIDRVLVGGSAVVVARGEFSF